MNGQDKAPSRWRRRVLGLPVVAWLIGIAGTALAVVGFIVVLGTAGSVTSAPPIDISYATNVNGSIIAGTPVCGGVRNSASQITLTITNAQPGDVCRYNVQVTTTAASAPARWQGFKLGSPGGTHLTRTNTGCGMTIAPGSTDIVSFDLAVKPTFPPGGSITFDPLLDGLEFRTASQYVAAVCTGA